MHHLVHILVVEHDQSVRHCYTEGLMRAGYHVSSTTSGEEVLVYLRLIIPDLILIGSFLPGMSRYELLHRLRSERAYAAVPVIMITTPDNLRTDVRSLDLGADDLIVEPVDMAELLVRVGIMQRCQRARRDMQGMQQRIALLLRLTQELGGGLNSMGS